MKLKRTTIIGIFILILSLIMQIGLLVASKIGAPDDSPVLVMYGFDEKLFPQTSFGNAVRSAGFDYVLLNKDLSKSLEIEEEISLPRGYRSRDVVYFVQGTDATSALKLFDNDEDTRGYILLNPVFETNFSMEGMGASYPKHDVAIYCGNEDYLKDARNMYERLSGEDTLYGVKYETGGILSSECYSNPKDNRFISISKIDYASTNIMVASPVFQIELANYLSANYGDASDIGTKGIVFWHSLNVFSSLIFIAGLILVVAQIQPLKFRSKEAANKTYSIISIVIIGIVTLVCSVGVILLMYIPKLQDIRMLGVSLVPVVLILCMALLRFVFIMKKNEIKAKDKTPSWYVWLIAFALVITPFMIFLNQFGIENFSDSGMELVMIFVAFVFDFVSILVLAAADNITRLLGDGGCSYYGKVVFAIFTAIPAVIALIVGLISNVEHALEIGLFGIISAVVPYLFSRVIKKRTMATLQVATVHSLLYLIILFLVA